MTEEWCLYSGRLVDDDDTTFADWNCCGGPYPWHKRIEVDPCVTQHYQDEDGKRWWWHCLVCDSGSNKYGRHRRGHKRESDALYGARQHAKDAYSHRVRVAEHAVWDAAIMSTDDVRVFRALAVQRYKRLDREDWQPDEAAMRDYQAKMTEIRNSMASRVFSEIVLTRGA